MSENPQGVLAVVDPIAYVEVDDLLQRAWDRGEDPFIVAAAGFQDPHNLGALLRTAEAAGCHGVIIPKDRAVGMTEAVIRTSAGAGFYIPVAQVTNLVRAAEQLKTRGVWIFGATAKGEYSLWEAPLTGPVGLVIGGEAAGIPRLLLETCDFTVAIPMIGKIESLNASAAAAVCIFEVVRRRNKA
jgi:23S rRNA (guanosine2251-2'-O)-methyltransferase